MVELNVVLLGGKKEIEFIEKRVKYPQLISSVHEWDEKLFQNVERDFFDSIDVLILAFEISVLASKVKKIIDEISVGRDIIVIDFYSFRWDIAPLMKADLLMGNPAIDHYDGIISGISHSEVGIIPERLDGGEFANLAVSSQDLYYNYKMLEYCLQKYPEKIGKIHTAVIDMYDYSYFNYDTSLTKQLSLYLGFGGYNKDEHNFERNHNYKGISYEEIVNLVKQDQLKGITSDRLSVWEMLFGDCIYDCFESSELMTRHLQYRTGVVSDSECEEFFLRSVADHCFEDTVRENTEILRKILALLASINPSIRIILVTIPRYEGAWHKEEAMRKNWKDRFESIVDGLAKEIPFEYYDLSRHEIATHRAYFNDPAHFNCYGAMKFTDLLNDIMQVH